MTSNKAPTFALAAIFIALIAMGVYIGRSGKAPAQPGQTPQASQANHAGQAVEAGQAAETIPPAPAAYFNDNAGVVSPGAAQQLDGKLRQFERDTSNQILVAIYPKMLSDSSIEDYSNRVAQSWKVGQAKTNNGAVLFVFVQDRAMFIQVGYGLEGALPDALAKQIIENDIIPQVRAGNWDAAMQGGVDGILAATKGEYKGTGGPVGGGGNQKPVGGIGFIVLFIIIILSSILRGRRGYGYGRTGFGPTWGGGGGFGGGGGGGFSGGGGGFGGGGAGGRW